MIEREKGMPPENTPSAVPETYVTPEGASPEVEKDGLGNVCVEGKLPTSDAETQRLVRSIPKV